MTIDEMRAVVDLRHKMQSTLMQFSLLRAELVSVLPDNPEVQKAFSSAFESLLNASGSLDLEKLK